MLATYIFWLLGGKDFLFYFFTFVCVLTVGYTTP